MTYPKLPSHAILDSYIFRFTLSNLDKDLVRVCYRENGEHTKFTLASFVLAFHLASVMDARELLFERPKVFITKYAMRDYDSQNKFRLLLDKNSLTVKDQGEGS